MTDKPEPSAALLAARKALEMKRAAGRAGGAGVAKTDIRAEKRAAAKAASKSKPKLRK